MCSFTNFQLILIPTPTQLCFVGQGRAGKTSTLASLNGAPFDPAQQSTIGIAADSVRCELSQQAVKAWKPNTSTLDAVHSAIVLHMAARNTPSSNAQAASITDVLLASAQDPASQTALEARIDSNKADEDASALDVAPGGEPQEPAAVPKKKSFFATLRKKPQDVPEAATPASRASLPPPPLPALPHVKSALEDAVARMDTNFLASKAASADKAIVFDT